MEKKKDSRKQEWHDFLAQLKSMPAEKLSKTAKYFLAHEHDEPVEMDMKAVLK